MANNTYTVAAGDIGVHDKALSGTDTVTFVDDLEAVSVLSDGAVAVYFTVDGTVASVSGSKTYKLPAGSPAERTVIVPTQDVGTVVSLVGTGATYSVMKDHARVAARFRS